jgi:hypothetical protein
MTNRLLTMTTVMCLLLGYVGGETYKDYTKGATKGPNVWYITHKVPYPVVSPTNKVIELPAGASLEAALRAANSGDVIILQYGAEYQIYDDIEHPAESTVEAQ